MSRHGQQPGWAGGQKGEPGWDTTATSRNQGAPSCPEGGAKARPPGLPSAWPTGALGCEPWCQSAWGGAGWQGQWGGPETPLLARPTAEAHCPNPAPRRLLYEDTVLTVGSPDHPAEQKAEVSPDSPPQREPTPATYGGPVQWTLQESSTIHAARTCLFHSTPQEQVDTQPLREHLSQLQEPGGAPRPLCSWPGLRAQDRWPWAEPTGASRGVARGLLTLRRDLVW